MSFQSSSVSIGNNTKKSDYDLLLDNTQDNRSRASSLESGTVAITHSEIQTFNSGTVFNATATFSSGIKADDGITVPMLYVRDQKTEPTDGGDFTAGGWRTRVLNTEVTNTITGASLSSNQITLPAGTYKVTARAPAYQTSVHATRFYNITDGASALIGSIQSDTPTTGGNDSTIMGILIITGAKVFELQHRCVVTSNTDGLGNGYTFGQDCIYAEVFIEKI